MITLLTDYSKNEIKVSRYNDIFHAKFNDNSNVLLIAAWQLAYNYAREFDEFNIQYIEVDKDGKGHKQLKLNLELLPFRMLIESFGGPVDIHVGQTFLGIQLFINNSNKKEK